MDVPLNEAQVIWAYHGDRPGQEAVKVVSRDGAGDDMDYFSSWGACNLDFNEADDQTKLLLLFQQFHHMVLVDGVDPKAVHDALMVIPEYRANISADLDPNREAES